MPPVGCRGGRRRSRPCDGLTAVTLSTTAVAPAGTTVAVPEGAIGTDPVTFSNFGVPDDSLPVIPILN